LAAQDRQRSVVSAARELNFHRRNHLYIGILPEAGSEHRSTDGTQFTNSSR
jgi:hypothetical protein